MKILSKEIIKAFLRYIIYTIAVIIILLVLLSACNSCSAKYVNALNKNQKETIIRMRDSNIITYGKADTIINLINSEKYIDLLEFELIVNELRNDYIKGK